jgi:plasmid stability protein
MASMLIRDLDPALKQRLRMRAAERGRSMEEEVRLILKRELGEAERPVHLVDLFAELFGHEGGVDLEPHPPITIREPPDFGE